MSKNLIISRIHFMLCKILQVDEMKYSVYYLLLIVLNVQQSRHCCGGGGSFRQSLIES